MANRAGIATKEKITSVSKRLFYEKGIHETTFADICEEAEVNQSSLYHHFKTKKNIVTSVCFDVMKNNLSITDQTFKNDYASETIYFLTCYTDWYLFFNNEPWRKFNTAMYSIIDYTDYQTYFETIFEYLNIDSYLQTKFSKNILGLKLATCVGAIKELNLFANNNLHDLTYDAVAEFNLTFYYDILDLPHKTFMQSMEQAKKIFDQLELTIKNGYELIGYRTKSTD
jgi:AcrR family transcriptional regulator